MSTDGGPIASIESGVLPVCGRQMVQVNARLSHDLSCGATPAIYGDADGTGTHREARIARQMAISEAIEKWVFHSTVESDRAKEFGFEIDPSSTGLCAVPGLTGRRARRGAMLEAVERFSVGTWWEGNGRWRLFETDWPGVSAVAIDGPFGGVTVIAFSRTDFGMFVYGHAAEESFGAACERAVVQLARHERMLYSWWLGFVSGEKRTPMNTFERRCLFFGTEEGHELFLCRLRDNVQTDMPSASVICDRDVPGPWSDYTTVWRFALRPASKGYLNGGDDYFFW
ncbi:MAG TPA: hypothetical protein VGM64_11440 [Lacunisphaera sp.]